jgi:hypothetical protein
VFNNWPIRKISGSSDAALDHRTRHNSQTIRERQIDGGHMVEVSFSEKAEHTDGIQAHQYPDHRHQNQAQKERR